MTCYSVLISWPVYGSQVADNLLTASCRPANLYPQVLRRESKHNHQMQESLSNAARRDRALIQPALKRQLPQVAQAGPESAGAPSRFDDEVVAAGGAEGRTHRSAASAAR